MWLRCARALHAWQRSTDFRPGPTGPFKGPRDWSLRIGRLILARQIMKPVLVTRKLRLRRPALSRIWKALRNWRTQQGGGHYTAGNKECVCTREECLIQQFMDHITTVKLSIQSHSRFRPETFSGSCRKSAGALASPGALAVSAGSSALAVSASTAISLLVDVDVPTPRALNLSSTPSLCFVNRAAAGYNAFNASLAASSPNATARSKSRRAASRSPRA